MAELFPFEEISPWVQVPEDLREPLADRLQADVVVVGAGYTGLSTALSLRAQGADVVVLEQDFAGCGASGRNAGHLTPTIGKDILTLLRLFGAQRATVLANFADAAVEYTEEVIRKHGIECEYVASGNLLAGVHPKHESRLAKAGEVARGLGAQVRFLSEGEMRERGLPPAFLCGVLEERGGTLHPGRYVMGLRHAAIEAGVRLFERTPLLELRDGARVNARTEGGEVTADHAVLATNAYTPCFRPRPRRVSSLRVSLFETEPLSDAQRDELGWRNREGIYTAHEMLENYRLTTRGTLVGGSKVVGFAWGNELSPGYDPAAFRVIEAAFRERFPTLGSVPVARFWGGWIALATDFLPVLGSEGAAGNVHHGLGYAGHGLAQGTLMGEMLAERVQGRRHEWETALKRRLIHWPPEPFRWVGARALTAVFSALDRRTDRQIRKGGR